MLTKISPIDGRYGTKTSSLSAYFSESALIKYRVKIEVAYFIWLSTLNIKNFLPLSNEETKAIEDIADQFSLDDAQWIKDKEKITNHDVKAVEYFVKDKLEAIGIKTTLEYVHFGLTSQDINNTSFPMMIRDATHQVLLPCIRECMDTLDTLILQCADIPMLARTHGQPASPTSLAKELSVFKERLQFQVEALTSFEYKAKFGGATGNFNAHKVTFPNIDWIEKSNLFISSLGLTRLQTTTQISHYDNEAELFHILCRLDTILLDFAKDIWTYISMDYFKQKVIAGEVGSSAMPHKVNPIDFENAEGNLGMANAILQHLANKLPISRLQRDLTDSTVLRNIGVPFGHILIALKSLIKGNGKLLVNKEKIAADLDQNWAVIAEAIQNILRREGYPKPYEALKGLTRGKSRITKNDFHSFIHTLNVDSSIKDELLAITPFNYTGYS